MTQQRNELTPVSTLRDLLDKHKGQITMALPKHMTAERMIRVAVTAFMKNPELQKCSAVSIASCVVQASELGLELTGPLGHAYMVPYWNKNTGCLEAQFQVGYRGYIELAYRSGKVITFTSRVVYANDHYKVFYGTNHEIQHEPTINDPGEPIAFYSVVKTKDGGMDFEFMSKTQIDLHRQKYSKTKADSPYSPWNTAYEEMAKKTPIRKLAKRVPLSIELTQAAVIDEYNEVGKGDMAVLEFSPGESQLDKVHEKLNGANGKALTNGEHEPEKTEPTKPDGRELPMGGSSTAPPKTEQGRRVRKLTAEAIRKEFGRRSDYLADHLKPYGVASVDELTQVDADKFLAMLIKTAPKEENQDADTAPLVDTSV